MAPSVIDEKNRNRVGVFRGTASPTPSVDAAPNAYSFENILRAVPTLTNVDVTESVRTHGAETAAARPMTLVADVQDVDSAAV